MFLKEFIGFGALFLMKQFYNYSIHKSKKKLLKCLHIVRRFSSYKARVLCVIRH